MYILAGVFTNLLFQMDVVSPKNIIIESDLEEELSVDWIASREQITIKSYCLSSTIIPLNIHSEFGRKYQAIRIGSNLH